MGGELDIDRCCMLSGRLGLLLADALENGPADAGGVSSKRSRTTTLGSVRVEVRLKVGPGLPTVLRGECSLARLLPGDATLAYSGRSEKLSGVTTTP